MHNLQTRKESMSLAHAGFQATIQVGLAFAMTVVVVGVPTAFAMTVWAGVVPWPWMWAGGTSGICLFQFVF